MKKIGAVLSIFLFPGLLFLGLPGCRKNPPPTKITITPLQQLINGDSSLTLFHSLILQANQTALLGTDAITVLAPVNTGFISAGYDAKFIDTLSATLAGRLILYHFLTEPLSLEPGTNISYPTRLGLPVYLTVSGDSIYFNGTLIRWDTVSAGTAIVYKLDAPLVPAFDSLAPLLGADSNFSLLAEAFGRTGLFDSLAGSPYTLLAPDNDAFIGAGYPDFASIDSADSLVLTDLLRNQVFPGLHFTNSWSTGTLTNLQGAPVSLTAANGGFLFSAAGNSVPANWLRGNMLAGARMVVHETDRILLP